MKSDDELKLNEKIEEESQIDSVYDNEQFSERKRKKNKCKKKNIGTDPDENDCNGNYSLDKSMRSAKKLKKSRNEDTEENDILKEMKNYKNDICNSVSIEDNSKLSTRNSQDREIDNEELPIIYNDEQIKKKKKHKEKSKDKNEDFSVNENNNSFVNVGTSSPNTLGNKIMKSEHDCMESEMHIKKKKKHKKDKSESSNPEFSIAGDCLGVSRLTSTCTINSMQDQKMSDDLDLVENDEKIKKKKKHKKNKCESSDCSIAVNKNDADEVSAPTRISPSCDAKQRKKKRISDDDAAAISDETVKKKKKRKEVACDVKIPLNSQKEINGSNNIDLQDEKSSNNAKPKSKGRDYTISIAIPISVVMETLLLEKLRTYVIGQLARAACIYSVDEIIVYDDQCWKQPSRVNEDTVENDLGMMKMILEYQECPQYLRPCFFPRHRNLQDAGLLNPLSAPHHLRADEVGIYREGIVVDKAKGNKSYVNVGLENYVLLDQKLEAGLRVTVKIPPGTEFLKKTFAYVVSPDEPRISEGLYWGYTVRVAKSLSEVLKSDRFEGDYDLIIGTSDKGDDSREAKFPQFSHALIVFGGMEGLEAAIAADKSFGERNITQPKDVFPYYLNVCPDQASRTIRTEEAVLIVLSTLTTDLAAKGLRK